MILVIDRGAVWLYDHKGELVSASLTLEWETWEHLAWTIVDPRGEW